MKIPLHKFEEWLINKNLKERTIENYIYYFNKFTFDVFDQETVSKFISLKSNRNSIARSFLVNFQKYLTVNYKELGLGDDVRLEIGEVELPKLTGRTRQRLIKPIPHDQIPLLEKHLETEQLKLQLLLSYYCALRLGELLKITPLSFNWDIWKKETSKMGECRVYGKGDKEGLALIPSKLMIRVARFIRAGNWTSLNNKLFVSNKTENVNLNNPARVFQRKLRQAGIDSGITQLDANRQPIKETVVHPHRLRHSYADYLLNHQNFNLREVQEVLRHSSIQSTQLYTYINKEHLKEKLSK